MEEQLTERQLSALLKFVKASNYEDRRFIIGPKPVSFFKQAKNIFNILKVGFYASSATEKYVPNSASQLVYYYVEGYQADKLLVALHQITERTYEDLSNGEVLSAPRIKPSVGFTIEQVKLEQPKKKRKKRKKKVKKED